MTVTVVQSSPAVQVVQSSDAALAVCNKRLSVTPEDTVTVVEG